MPTRILRAAGTAALAVACSIALPATAGASKPADLRVVDSSGETLAEHSQYTGKTRIRARKRADCFGDGTGGSGDRVKVPRATALGIAHDAGKWDRDIKPTLITDAFDFGLGVCGFGRAVAPQTGYWYLKINGVGSRVGGDQARLKSGDRVVWYLIEDFNDPIPAELMVRAPARTTSSEFTVRVWSYTDDGSRVAAEGATVTGAGAPTDADGRTTVAARVTNSGGAAAEVRVRATMPGAIPSNLATTCVAEKLSACGSRPPTVIRGSAARDIVRGTRGNDDIAPGRGRDVVRAGRGDDFVDVRRGGRDIVRCGAGDDRVRADGRDKLRGCN
jgi:hypothetical protein